MFVIANFLNAVATIINLVLSAYMWVVIGRAVISWVNADPYNPIVQFIYNITEPLMTKIRRVLPVAVGGIDFSPMILIMGIIFLQSFLVPTLHHFAEIIR